MRRDPRVRLKASDERQAQSMMPKIERYTDTLKQAQRQKV